MCVFTVFMKLWTLLSFMSRSNEIDIKNRPATHTYVYYGFVHWKDIYGGIIYNTIMDVNSGLNVCLIYLPFEHAVLGQRIIPVGVRIF